MVFDPVQNKVVNIWFNGLPLDEEKLTAYEIGSKNQFLGKTLQLNGAIFY